MQSHAGLPPANEAPAFFPLYPGRRPRAQRLRRRPRRRPRRRLCGLAELLLRRADPAASAGRDRNRRALRQAGADAARLLPRRALLRHPLQRVAVPAARGRRLPRRPHGLLGDRRDRPRARLGDAGPRAAARRPGALLYLYGPRSDRDPESARGGWWPRYRLRPDAAWLLLAPLGIVAFSAYLHFALGDALAWDHAQVVFGRHTVDPFTGAWDALRAAGESLGRIVSQPYTEPTSDHLNVAQVGFVAFAIAGGIGALRRLPVAYGAWVLVSLVPLFVSQPPDNPLWSSPRFIAVLFPIFLWLAIVSERREFTTTVVAIFAAGLSIFSGLFALWSFFA